MYILNGFVYIYLKLSVGRDFILYVFIFKCLEKCLFGEWMGESIND